MNRNIRSYVCLFSRSCILSYRGYRESMTQFVRGPSEIFISREWRIKYLNFPIETSRSFIYISRASFFSWCSSLLIDPVRNNGRHNCLQIGVCDVHSHVADVTAHIGFGIPPSVRHVYMYRLAARQRSFLSIHSFTRRGCAVHRGWHRATDTSSLSHPPSIFSRLIFRRWLGRFGRAAR